jgi:hypothetical protein
MAVRVGGPSPIGQVGPHRQIEPMGGRAVAVPGQLRHIVLREHVGHALAHLAEQPVLCDPYDMAIGTFVTQSILVTRERLGGELEGLAGDSVLTEGLCAMQAACRMFLEENQSPRSGYGSPYEAQLHSTLGALRALVGIHIARIACAYDLEVDAHLEGMLPPAPG